MLGAPTDEQFGCNGNEVVVYDLGTKTTPGLFPRDAICLAYLVGSTNIVSSQRFKVMERNGGLQYGILKGFKRLDILAFQSRNLSERQPFSRTVMGRLSPYAS